MCRDNKIPPMTMPSGHLPTLYTALADDPPASGGPTDPPDTIETRVIETTDESNLLDLFLPGDWRSDSVEIKEDGIDGNDDLYRNLGHEIRDGDDDPHPPDTVFTHAIETIDNDRGLTLLHHGC